MAQATKKSPARPNEMEIWKSVVDSWKRAQKAGEKNLLAVGFSVAEYRVMRKLRDEGASAMVKLSAEALLSQPTMTGLVDKLEGLGLVERVRNQQDRREVLIAITSKGNESLARAEETHKRWVEKSLSVLDPDQMVLLVRLLGRLAEATEKASHSDR